MDVIIQGNTCPICKQPRTYKTKQGAKKGKNKPCKSCANSLKMGGSGMIYTEKGERLCSKCKVNPIGWNTYCNECNKKERKKYWTDKMRFDRYSITKEEFEKVLAEQNYSCKTCNSTENLCIDHDHDTNKFRGILCRKCNTALGLLRDNSKIIFNLLNYINKCN